MSRRDVPRKGGSKVLAACLAGGALLIFALSIGLFNFVASRWLKPNYHPHEPASEFLLQIPFTLSRTYTVTLECGTQPRREITVKEWSHRAAGLFALERMPDCSRTVSVRRWRKRGRA